MSVAGLASLLQAQDSPVGSGVPLELVVNGHLIIKAKLKEIDGKHFVAVEDLAQGLGGSVGYGPGKITLSLDISSPSDAKRTKLAA
jgi:hypothetical protein